MREVRCQDPERHHAVEPFVVGLEHAAHAAGAQQFEDPVRRNPLGLEAGTSRRFRLGVERGRVVGCRRPIVVRVRHPVLAS
jgi:hypothetical protein